MYGLINAKKYMFGILSHILAPWDTTQPMQRGGLVVFFNQAHGASASAELLQDKPTQLCIAL